jgi:hypothetical protein
MQATLHGRRREADRNPANQPDLRFVLFSGKIETDVKTICSICWQNSRAVQ